MELVMNIIPLEATNLCALLISYHQ